MIITVAGFKGGVAKTTTAVHLACYFQTLAPTLLVDGDPNRSATKWAERGGFPFKVVDERAAVKFAREAEHTIIDTKARPEPEDLEALAAGCDLLVVPTTPDALALDALTETIGALQTLGADTYRILLTIVPPKPSKDEEEARAALGGLPIFKGHVRRFVAFQKAALLGVPVYDAKDARSSLGWKDYRNIGKEIL